MGFRDIRPTGREQTFDQEEIIVSKTDRNGRLTYVNDVFVGISGYTEEELIGAPHSLVRHPDMPRAIFKLLWETIQDRREMFAYVVNLTATGDHHWVLAHLTPSFGANREIVGFHSNRRQPRRDVLDQIRPLYAKLVAEEAKHQSKADGIAASSTALAATLTEIDMTYEEYVRMLPNEKTPPGAA